jgi:hypothetical protein
MSLADSLAVLELSLSDLKAERDLGPLQNDVYEAIDDLCHLGQRAVAKDARVNYPVRAGSDLALFRKLRDIVSARTEKDRDRYLPLLDCAEQLLRQIAQIPIPMDGHLGVLRVIRSYFDFLFDHYGFTITREQPTGMHLACGAVVVELGWATQSSQSFSMSRGDSGRFWVEDLLYLNRDQRYLSVPQAIQLSNEADVDDWFQFISGALHQYGDELLRDIPGAFDRLAHAQSERDAEYVAKMNAEYGASGPELHSL